MSKLDLRRIWSILLMVLCFQISGECRFAVGQSNVVVNPFLVENQIAGFANARYSWMDSANSQMLNRKPCQTELECLELMLREYPEVFLSVPATEKKLLNVQELIKLDSGFRFTRKQLQEISSEVTEKLRGGLTEEQQLELTDQVLTELASLVSKRSILIFRQCEVFVDGPVSYFQRADIAREFQIDADQIERMQKVAAEQAGEYREQYRRAREKLILDSFDQLNVDQKKTLQRIFGLRLETVSGLFRQISDRELTMVTTIYDPQIEGPPQNPGEYVETYISTLYAAFAEDEGLETKLRDSLSFANSSGTPSEPNHDQIEVRPQPVSFLVNTSGNTVCGLLPELRKVLNRTETPLSDEQERLFKIKMEGDGVVDGLNGPPISRVEMTPLSRVQRKMKPWIASLTRDQKQVVRDAMLLKFGPFRILLCDVVSQKLQVDAEQRLALLNDSFEIWQELRKLREQLKRLAFQAVMDQLTEKQQQGLQTRLDTSLQLLADRYSGIDDRSFFRDFERK